MSVMDPYVGQKFPSFEALKKYLEDYGRNNFFKFWIRSSHKIGSLKTKTTKNVNPSLKYVCMKFACIFGGEKIRCRGVGIRRRTTFRNPGCPCTINAVIGEDGNHVKLETVILEHNHVLCKSLYETLKGSKSKLQMFGGEVTPKNNLSESWTNENGADDSVRNDKVSCEENNFQDYLKQIQEKYGSNIKIIVVNREDKDCREENRLNWEDAEEEEEPEESIDDLEQFKLLSEKEVCRLCLSTSNKLTPIFKPSLPLESTILSFKIMSCASIEISNDDQLPCSICSTCEEILDIAYNFRMRCENSDSILRKGYSANRFINTNGYANAKEEEPKEVEQVEYPEIVKGEGETVAVIPEEVQNDLTTCPICGTAFGTYPEVLSHLKEHNDAENYLLTCNICTIMFTTVKGFLEHMEEHINLVKNEWSDNQCNVTFLSEEEAAAAAAAAVSSEEVKEDSDGKTSGSGYLCNVCGKILKSKDRFQSHRNTHEGLRPHICLKCGKGFADRKNMHQHFDIVHLRKAKHECPICHKKFYAPTKMKSHITMHYGVKPFSCDVCNKTFRLRMNMMKHKKTHSNERPHKCDKCSAAFIDKNLLTRHSYVHGGVRPYVCPYCAHRFTLKFNLKKHMTSGRCSGRGKTNEEIAVDAWGNESLLTEDNKCEDGERTDYPDGSDSIAIELPEFDERQ